jgi:cbb3-type cytochrome c oxidase subunit III
MRLVSRRLWLTCAVAALTLPISIFAVAAYAQSPDAAKMKNPVPSSPASIAAGKKLFDANCVSCHGPAGKGDGKGGAMLKPQPSDLTDGEWKHGSTEGEIFTVVRDGVQRTGMRAYGSRIPANDIWNLVNYVRSLSSKTTKSH